MRVALEVLGLPLIKFEVEASEPPGLRIVQDEDGEFMIVGDAGDEFPAARADGKCDDDDCDECNDRAKSKARKSRKKKLPFGFTAG